MGTFSIKYGGRTVFFQNSSVFERILRGCGILVVCGRILKVLRTILIVLKYSLGINVRVILRRKRVE